MRFLLPVALAIPLMTSGVAGGEIVNHCSPDGSGGMICRLERVAPSPLPQVTLNWSSPSNKSCVAKSRMSLTR